MNKRLFIDMDGVLAEFKNVPFSALLRDGYFKSLRPQKRVVRAVKSLCRRKDTEVFILSSYLIDCNALKEKNEWLDTYLPEIDQAHRIFLPCGDSKVKAVPDFNPDTDVLIDDYGVNCRAWAEHGGVYVKVSRSLWDALKEMKKHDRVIWPAARKKQYNSQIYMVSGKEV